MVEKPIPWEAGEPRRITWPARLLDYVVLSEAHWARHIVDPDHGHPCMREHWEKIAETLEKPNAVDESRINPKDVLVYSRYYEDQPPISGECSRSPTLLVMVNRATQTIATAFFADFPFGKLGKRLWPK